MNQLPSKFKHLANKLVHKNGYYEINLESNQIDLVFELLRLDKNYLSNFFKEIFNNFITETKYIPPEAETKFDNFIYRGQVNHEWDLVPNSLRCIDKINMPYTKNELENLLQFLKCCDEMAIPTPHDSHKIRDNIKNLLNSNTIMNGNNWVTQDYYELLGYAQHYGLSTRLLDWSYHYLVGLYFSSIEMLKKQKKKPQYFSLFILCIDHLESKTFSKCMKIDIPSGLNKHISLQQGCFVLVEQSEAMNSPVAKDAYSLFDLEHELEIQYVNNILQRYSRDFQLLKLNFPKNTALQVFKYCNAMGFNASNLFESGEALKKRLEEIKFL